MKERLSHHETEKGSLPPPSSEGSSMTDVVETISPQRKAIGPGLRQAIRHIASMVERGAPLRPRDRVPSPVADLIDEFGLPHFYVGPMYTGRNGAQRTSDEVQDLITNMPEHPTEEDEIGPLPPGVGVYADYD